MKPGVQVVLAEPGWDSVPTEDNPAPAEIDSSVHRVTEEFHPKTLDVSVFDEAISVETKEAHETARALARDEGLFVGASSGAAVWVATRVSALVPPAPNRNRRLAGLRHARRRAPSDPQHIVRCGVGEVAVRRPRPTGPR